MRKVVFIILITFIILLLATPVLAQTNQIGGYNSIINIPGAGEIEGISDYIKALYLFGLAIVGVIAMLFVIIGGIRYMTAAGNETAISDAKGQITAAILGLVLVLTSWLILNTINPELVTLKKLFVEPVETRIRIGKYWVCRTGKTGQGYTGCLTKEECTKNCTNVGGNPECYYEPKKCGSRPKESYLKCDKNRNMCIRVSGQGYDDPKCVGKSEDAECEEEAPPVYYTCKNLKCVTTDDPELAEAWCGNEPGRNCLGWHLECINNKCVSRGTGHTTKPDEEGCKKTEGKGEGSPCP